MARGEHMRARRATAQAGKLDRTRGMSWSFQNKTGNKTRLNPTKQTVNLYFGPSNY